jgi:hypothetical protein
VIRLSRLSAVAVPVLWLVPLLWLVVVLVLVLALWLWLDMLNFFSLSWTYL